MSIRRVCVFCGASNLTREHVLPNWISKMFTAKLTATTTIEKQGQPDKIYKSALLQHKVKVVCAKCNNGWMSQLESDVKSILSRMLFALDQGTALGAKEQNILAFWAQKTVMILDLSTEAEYKIPSESYIKLYNQQKPIKEITVRLGWRIPKKGKYGPHLSHFTISDISGPEKPAMVAEAGEFEVWRAILAIGNVVFHINGSTPNINVEVGNVDKRVTPQIFPYEKDVIWPLEWPVDALTSVGFDEFSKL
jgi:hypothetical protein